MVQRLTASNFGVVYNKLLHTHCDNIVKKMLYSNFELSEMRYGRMHEKDAIQEISKILKVTVLPCRLFIDSDLSYLAPMPDGLIDEDG